jgi:hypothetical protein
LVEADNIEDGRQVVSALENSGLKISAAFWSSWEDGDEGYLIVVSPDVAEKGSTSVYKQAFVTYQLLKERAGTGDKPVSEGWALDSYIYKLE